jgi:molybdopterin-containing oxidoreductase family iron-sulfur binding subunit
MNPIRTFLIDLMDPGRPISFIINLSTQISERMNERNTQDQNSRRKFLKLGLIAGAGTVATGGLLSSCGKKDASGEKIRVLTTGGEIMEVDKNFLTLAPVGIHESHQGIPGRKFVMVIDLARCKNARSALNPARKVTILRKIRNS